MRSEERRGHANDGITSRTIVCALKCAVKGILPLHPFFFRHINETLIRRSRSYTANGDDYTDAMDTLMCKWWYIQCNGMS